MDQYPSIIWMGVKYVRFIFNLEKLGHMNEITYPKIYKLGPLMTIYIIIFLYLC